MVRRVVTHSNLDYPRDTNQQGPIHSEPRELAADHDFRSDHARWYVAAIIANRAMAGPGPTAIPVLAFLASDASLVCGANASGEGVAGSQELDLNVGTAATGPAGRPRIWCEKTAT